MGKVSYIHYLRGLAAFFIVVIHFNLFSSDTMILGRFFKYFLLEWTAVFVMISGFLFQYLLHKYQFNRFMVAKVKNVILPYLIISIPAILIYVLGFKKDHVWLDIPELLNHSVFYVVVFFYATGTHLGPLWFIPVLILIFLTSKPLSIIGKNDYLLKLFAFLSVLMILITERPQDNSNVFLAYLHFLPVYILGMFICSKRDMLINKRNKSLFLILFIASFLLCSFFELNSSLVILSKIPLFLYLCIFLSDLSNKRAQSALSILADTSFSVYFLHGYFVGAARKILVIYNHPVNNFQAIFLSVFISSMTILFLIGLYLLLKRFNMNSRAIIGS